ncbi:hypothetical protein CYJ40_04990 [Brevibacterium ravenspurgense]|uniref:YitT family protein n=2 Tax=Brevibacterium TaxID=1696 RepID=A0A2I1IH83_9MICO|nr:YitT family protein [Brevibacterium ravenspurgense]PKY70481.1 hypothetical protein CYJ40_04990 [Brevibacterium ravenspurgense]
MPNSAENPVSSPVFPAPVRHRWYENILGFITGSYLTSIGLAILHSAQAVTGGTAGLALLVSYVVDLPIGVLFPLVNLPFFALAIWKKGWGFTLRTLLAVSVVGVLADFNEAMLGLHDLPILYGVPTGSVIAGVGILILFRHGASLGGFNILALILQERAGLNAGSVLMALDAVIVLASFFVSPWQTVLVSVIGVVVLNIVLAVNHKPGRYTGY